MTPEELLDSQVDHIFEYLPVQDRVTMHAYIDMEKKRAVEHYERVGSARLGIVGSLALIGGVWLLMLGTGVTCADAVRDKNVAALRERCIEQVECPCLPPYPESAP